MYVAYFDRLVLDHRLQDKRRVLLQYNNGYMSHSCQSHEANCGVL